MIKKLVKLAFICSFFIFNSQALAGGNFAFGPKIGTQGLGLEARTPIIDNNLYLRLGGNYFQYKRSEEVKAFGSKLINNTNLQNPIINNIIAGGVDFNLPLKGKLKLLTVPIMFDYHPFDNSGFRVTAGVAYNGNKIDIDSRSVITDANGSVIDGNTQLVAGVTADQFNKDIIGTLSGSVKVGNSFAGILTIGYDNSFMNTGPFSFSAEAGLMYAGKPKVTIKGTGSLFGDKEVVDYLNREVDSQFKALNKYLKFYPILSIGVKYTF